MTHTFSPSIEEAEAILNYIVSSRTVRLCLRKQTENPFGARNRVLIYHLGVEDHNNRDNLGYIVRPTSKTNEGKMFLLLSGLMTAINCGTSHPVYTRKRNSNYRIFLFAHFML